MANNGRCVTERTLTGGCELDDCARMAWVRLHIQCQQARRLSSAEVVADLSWFVGQSGCPAVGPKSNRLCGILGGLDMGVHPFSGSSSRRTGDRGSDCALGGALGLAQLHPNGEAPRSHCVHADAQRSSPLTLPPSHLRHSRETVASGHHQPHAWMKIRKESPAKAEALQDTRLKGVSLGCTSIRIEAACEMPFVRPDLLK
jgi:hypothetical protein